MCQLTDHSSKTVKNTLANHPALPDFTLTLILHCWRISQKLSHIPGRVRAQFNYAEEGVL